VTEAQRENPAAYLADMIEKGEPHIKESRRSFIIHDGEGVCGCALGMAIVGRFGDAEKALERYHSKASDGHIAISELLDIPRNLAFEINIAHHLCGIPAAEIIDKLRAGEFDECVQR